jgi:hypothetical protein
MPKISQAMLRDQAAQHVGSMDTRQFHYYLCAIVDQWLKLTNGSTSHIISKIVTWSHERAQTEEIRGMIEPVLSGERSDAKPQ